MEIETLKNLLNVEKREVLFNKIFNDLKEFGNFEFADERELTYKRYC